jgi:hypothetical protein
VRRLLAVILALCIGVGGFVHLRVWQNEYRHAPVREMFVANWVASALIVLLLLAVVARPVLMRSVGWLASAGALLVAVGSLAAFALSRLPGLPTLHGRFKVHGIEDTSSYFFHVGSAKTILVAEALAAAISAAVLIAHRDRARAS